MFTYVDYYDEFSRQNNKLISQVEKAINGEYSAILCYERLAKLAPNKEERNQILEIQKDEKKHFNEFGQIYYNLTGMQPQPKISEECPNNYLAGLEFALKDEQETVDFYLEVSDETNNSYVREVFRRAAADEQNHAVWFLYFFVKEKKRSTD